MKSSSFSRDSQTAKSINFTTPKKRGIRCRLASASLDWAWITRNKETIQVPEVASLDRKRLGQEVQVGKPEVINGLFV